jgi:hypothetical protein
VTTGDEITAGRIDRCSIVAGLLPVPTAAHPDDSETTFADAARDAGLWVPMHAAPAAVTVRSLAGLNAWVGATVWSGARVGPRAPVRPRHPPAPAVAG